MAASTTSISASESSSWKSWSALDPSGCSQVTQSLDNCAATPAHQVSARFAVRNATRAPGCKPSRMNTAWMRPIRSMVP
ncbi:hypothetical protein ACVWXN_009484 [Bradyrhizobium sp. i1.4.4]